MGETMSKYEKGRGEFSSLLCTLFLYIE